jgi:hypothetical protein
MKGERTSDGKQNIRFSQTRSLKNKQKCYTLQEDCHEPYNKVIIGRTKSVHEIGVGVAFSKGVNQPSPPLQQQHILHILNNGSIFVKLRSCLLYKIDRQNRGSM